MINSDFSPDHPVELTGLLSLDDIERVANGAEVALTDRTRERVRIGRIGLERRAASDAPIYGVNTGFGALVSAVIEPSLQHQLQINLLRSHAAGVGLPSPEIVRAAMAIRLST